LKPNLWRQEEDIKNCELAHETKNLAETEKVKTQKNKKRQKVKLFAHFTNYVLYHEDLWGVDV
jgi:hypothetical protein